jgi:hypothetical protein
MVREPASPLLDLVPAAKVIPESRPGQGGVLFMKDGSFRMVLAVGAVSVLMKSPMEREALAAEFGELCNSLSPGMPIQITVQTSRRDMTDYLKRFDSAMANRYTPEPLKDLIASHQQHLASLVAGKTLIRREYFAIVPWRGTRTNRTSDANGDSIGSMVKRLAGHRAEAIVPSPSDLDVATAQQQLDLRAERIQNHLDAMGLWSYRLDEEDIRRLLWDRFHPGRLTLS